MLPFADAGDITWPQVVMAAISAMITVVTTIASILFAYFNLKGKLAESEKKIDKNTQITTAAAVKATKANMAAVAAVKTTNDLHEKVDAIYENTNGRFQVLVNQLNEAREEVARLTTESATADRLAPVVEKVEEVLEKVAETAKKGGTKE